MSSYCELKDFDWSARVVLASDKISGLKQPLVILKLFLQTPMGLEEKQVEFSQTELHKFLTNLRQAKQKIQDNFKEES